MTRRNRHLAKRAQAVRGASPRFYTNYPFLSSPPPPPVHH